MDKYLYISVFAICIGICGCEGDGRMSTDLINNPATASKSKEGIALANIKFDSPVLEFGSVVAGRRISNGFSFINSGDAPLIIADVHSPCGCTVAKDWPKEAIEPGKGGVIVVEFDSTDRIGHQDKKIDVVTNSDPSITQVTLVGNVIGPDFIPGNLE